MLSNKIVSNEKITTVAGDKIIEKDKGTAKILSEFFYNIVTNFNIPQFNQIDLASEKTSDPVIKIIVKYRAHSSVIAVKGNCTSKSNFDFLFVDKGDILDLAIK